MTDRAEPDQANSPVIVAPSLSPAERKALRAAAHHLDPVVMVGDAGVSDAVIAEADRALKAHELIKVRVLGDDRDARAQAMNSLCERLGAAPVQSIGKLLVIYRPRPEQPDSRSTVHQPKKQVGQAAEQRATSKSKRPPLPRAPKPNAQRTPKPAKKPAPKASPKAGPKPATRSSATSARAPGARPAARRPATTARRVRGSHS